MQDEYLEADNLPYSTLKLPKSILWRQYQAAKSAAFKRIIGLFWQKGMGSGLMEKFISPTYARAVNLQGWKLHVSATIEQSLAAAVLVLPIIESLGFDFKMGSISLQEMWNQHESQAGKFITIYTSYKEHPDLVMGDGQNKALTEELIRKLDAVLLDARKKGILSNENLPIPPGDAQIGESGFLFIRYGAYFSKEIYDLSLNEWEDDIRGRPWPDFINKLPTSPFSPELNLRWNPPSGAQIAWDNRPKDGLPSFKAANLKFE